MTYARDFILTLTILAIIFATANRPQPVKDNQTPFCVQPVWDRFGREVGGAWVPCGELDRYEQI